MMRVFLVALGVLLVGLAAFVLKLLSDAGELTVLTPHFEGRCRRVAGVPGAEDVAIDRERGVAFLSSLDRRAVGSGGDPHGAVYLYDLRSRDAAPLELTAELSAGAEFWPLGISLFRSGSGARRLFVVNRRPHDRSVELFDVRDGRLIHRETISTRAVGPLNDVQAVGERAFYATQDHGAGTKLGELIEDYLRLPWAVVVYYDGDRFRTAAEGIKYANGINLSPDGRRLYVGSSTGKYVRVYDRDPGSGALRFRRDIEVPLGADNIDVAPGGDLWVAGHPKLLTFARYAAGARGASPSMVVRVVTPASPALRVEEILVDDGALLSASSVAAVFEDLLVIGTVYDDHFLVCRRRDGARVSRGTSR